jgi:rare lipoprotein A
MKNTIYTVVTCSLLTPLVVPTTSYAQSSPLDYSLGSKETITTYNVQSGLYPVAGIKTVMEIGITKINAYTSNDKPTATLYVKELPIISFLGNQGSTDPMTRATAIAAKINQLKEMQFDANKIVVSKKENCDCYSIKADQQELLEINSRTILADSTQNLGNDALQVTNRLRRLIGKAAPLTDISQANGSNWLMNIQSDRPEMAAVNIPVTIADEQKPAVKLAAVSNVKIEKNTVIPPVTKDGLVVVRSLGNGMASWYGAGFHGGPTASGERYNQYSMTAAHKTLPFNTRVLVTNLRNGKSVVVRINNRGPFIRGRVIDLSKSAAQALDMIGSGVAPVKLEILGRSQSQEVANSSK